MSEQAEVPETGPVSVDDVLHAIQQKNIAQAKAAFSDVMSQKVNDALESEKVKVASQIFNNNTEEGESEDEVSAQFEQEFDAEEDTDTESELEAEIESILDDEEEIES
jgi:hypothetical protein